MMFCLVIFFKIAVMQKIFFSINLFTCFFMTGLIWLVQVVHYPAYKFIDKTRFTEYQTFHTTSISYIVLPIMLAELVSGFGLIFEGEIEIWKILNLLGILGIWLSTFLLSVPFHNQLQNGWDLLAIERLIQTNWIRTAIWSLRSLGWFYYLLI